ncbi:MAG TPA: hypothetical protein VNJ70_13460 [Thermoanaerobaculia bacterium]|nr:hypothetical protein [Thermoanaerobaculia bacterium]
MPETSESPSLESFSAGMAHQRRPDRRRRRETLPLTTAKTAAEPAVVVAEPAVVAAGPAVVAAASAALALKEFRTEEDPPLARPHMRRGLRPVLEGLFGASPTTPLSY